MSQRPNFSSPASNNGGALEGLGRGGGKVGDPHWGKERGIADKGDHNHKLDFAVCPSDLGLFNNDFLIQKTPPSALKCHFSSKPMFIIACPLFSSKLIFRFPLPLVKIQNCSPTCPNSKLLSHLSKLKIAGWRDGGGEAGGQAGRDHHQDREQSSVI